VVCPYETTPSCSPRYMSLIEYLYDHGYIYRKLVYITMVIYKYSIREIYLGEHEGLV
jgi:hypothetical protein